jgi:hypothetical protein
LVDCVYDWWSDAIPDAAFKATAEDNREIARRVTGENRRGRRSNQLLLAPVLVQLPDDLVELFMRLGAGAEESLAEVTIRAGMFEEARHRQDYRHLFALANAWTAAFFWPLLPGTPAAPTQELFATLHTNPAALPRDTARLVADIAEDRRFFHFEIAWPEVFASGRGGFDVVVGNPPYLGGTKISGNYGNKVLYFLKRNHPARTNGREDLAAFFLRRGFDLLRMGGDLCFITTNTIAQGDTRLAGLDAVTTWGGELADAVRSQPWEGSATVAVALVHLHRGQWPGRRTLDGEDVEAISTDLGSGQSGATLSKLTANHGLASKGSDFMGEGFFLGVEEAERLIGRDVRDAEVVRPMLGAREAMSSPSVEPTRYVIDFGEMSEEIASSYIEPFELVRRRVKPMRERQRRASLRNHWWRFNFPRNAFYQKIQDRGLKRVIVIPEVSKTMLPVFAQAGIVYSHKLIVFADGSEQLLGELTSSFHWLWAAKYCATMRSDPPTVQLSASVPSRAPARVLPSPEWLPSCTSTAPP